MGNPNAVMGAMTMCSFGLAPSSIMVNRPTVLVEGRPAANITDFVPYLNIQPFGLCQSLANPLVAAATAAALGTLTPAPCIPSVVAPWTPMAPTTLVGGSPALTAGSTCQCVYGGTISITMPGTTRTTTG